MERMYPAYNSQSTQLLTDISPAAKTIPVADPSVFPEGPNYATIGTDDRAEVVLYQAVDAQGGQLTGVERGKSFTVSRGWLMGSEVYHCGSADNMNAIMRNVGELDEKKADETVMLEKLGQLDAAKANLAGPTFTGQPFYKNPSTPVWHAENLPVEQGSWKPTLASDQFTYRSQVGHYAKIGKTLFITGGIILSAVATIDNSRLTITGLPFKSGDAYNGGVAPTFLYGYTLGPLTFYIKNGEFLGSDSAGKAVSYSGVQPNFQLFFQGVVILP